MPQVADVLQFSMETGGFLPNCISTLQESLIRHLKIAPKHLSFLEVRQKWIRVSIKVCLIWHPTPVPLPGNSHGRRSLVGCSPWGREESDTTERLHFHFFTFLHWRRKWQPTPVFLPGESQGRGSLVGCRLWGHTESDMTEAT